jgi:hypothetical protein
MADERAKPFVAWWPNDWVGEWPAGVLTPLVVTKRRNYRNTVPVVVTPLLPDDPRPGETWQRWSGGRAEILAVFDGAASGERMAYVRQSDGTGRVVSVSDLRRPPVLKTFRVQAGDKLGGAMCQVTVQATDREAALAKLAESLEEVG